MEAYSLFGFHQAIILADYKIVDRVTVRVLGFIIGSAEDFMLITKPYSTRDHEKCRSHMGINGFLTVKRERLYNFRITDVLKDIADPKFDDLTHLKFNEPSLSYIDNY